MRCKKHGRRDFKILCLAAMSACIPAARPAQAQTAVWTGGAGNWNNPTLWNTGVVPNDPSVDVAIDSGNFASSVVNLNISATARTISIDAGDTLQYSKQKSLYLTGGGTFNGNVQMVSFDKLTAIGSQTFGGTGQISLLSAKAQGYGGSITVGSADGKTPATLTLQSGLIVREAAGFIGGDLVDHSHVINEGSIVMESNPHSSEYIFLQNVINEGTIRSNNSNPIIATNFHNTAKGVVTATDGSDLSLLSPFTNAGRIDLSNSNLTVDTIAMGPGSLAASTGTITASNTGISYFGTFTPADLNSIHRSGTGSTTLGGTLLNTGNTLTLNAITGNLTLDEGHIIGGTIATTDGEGIYMLGNRNTASTLEGNVVLAVDVRIAHQAILAFSGGLTMAGNTIRFRTEDSHFSFTENETLSGTGTIDFGTSSGKMDAYSPGSVLEIGPGIHIHGSFGSMGGTLSGDDAFILNRGTITADAGPGYGFHLNHVTNAGNIEITAGATMGASLLTQTSGSLRVNGTLKSGYDLNLTGGLLTGAGSISLVSGSNVPNLFIGGNLAPGNSIGTLSVTGRVTLTGTGHYTAELQGARSADLLAVDGDLNLGIGSTLDIASLGSLVNGNNYLIATYTGALTGTFTQVTAGFEISYATPHEIRVSPVPEPGMGWGLGTTLAIITLGRRASAKNGGTKWSQIDPTN